jgi:hypothetical protein
MWIPGVPTPTATSDPQVQAVVEQGNAHPGHAAKGLAAVLPRAARQQGHESPVHIGLLNHSEPTDGFARPSPGRANSAAAAANRPGGRGASAQRRASITSTPGRSEPSTPYFQLAT